MRTQCQPSVVISGFMFMLAVAPNVAPAQGNSNRGGASAQSAASSSEVALPPWVEKLNLASQQQQQARAIVRDYDSKVVAAWQQFTECYQQTIKIEAVLLTAIEDNLNDSQRNQARDLRRKTAQSENFSSAAAITPITLTSEQEAAADKINAKYLSRLRSLNRDITALHNRLVSLEADKIVEIEKILTKPQIQKLSEIRQEAPLPTAPAINTMIGTKNE
ncbi:MAG: hypothetical protein JF612_07720 [Planctomycetia bacterium]|nr:hypothetical protein [Planctomycetia bacterium]